MGATLINVFIVPRERETEFLEQWRKTAAHFADGKGLLETHLHRNTGMGNESFSFVNIARWTSAEAWHSSHDAFPPGEYRIPGVKGHPAIFETCVNVYSGEADRSTADGHWIASVTTSAA
ncbi:antibiotic biosynthesis monooxygenase [Amycolatopsis sp. WQ 127309]|uniref:antibiotic biosynthesis monooxygenase family protein n=1 Tax=Amycolatopsis sp. WQ 127309 TaxID=2932773 RepID=UPI001FF0F83D|nr:antibiotic biosynthesis monooxygenase family protein [Amycolatopsis sp. WQ 127309]UOZ06924.1 antibiotic biosynthesis monooxygenase [Amycolatopsis sp. WQ 127309]